MGRWLEGMASGGISFEGMANVRPATLTSAACRPSTSAQLNSALLLEPSITIAPPAGRRSWATALAGRAFDGMALDGIPFEGIALDGIARYLTSSAGGAADGGTSGGNSSAGTEYMSPFALIRATTSPSISAHLTPTHP